MPTDGEPTDLLVDTSVAIALVVADHEHHDLVLKALTGRRLGLAGHAAFETFSVLTRLPAPARLTAAAARRAIAVNFPGSRFLGARRAAGLLKELAAARIVGGSVYDGLVGAVAREHRLPLGTRDRRALATYLALEVEVQLLG